MKTLAYPSRGALRIVEEFPLDVFTLMPARQTGRSLGYADLIGDAQQRDLGSGIIVSYASIARLLDLKAGTGRAKDAADIAILSEIARGDRPTIPVDLAATNPVVSPYDSEQGDWPLPAGDGSR